MRPKRRHLQADDEAVEEIGPEPAGLGLLVDVPVRRRHHPDPHMPRLMTAEPPDLPVLHEAEELSLESPATSR